MRLPKQQFFQMADIDAFSQLGNALLKQYALEKDHESNGTIRFFDSFDWRLLKKDRFLIQENSRMRLSDKSGELLVETDINPADSYFWWDFPDSEFRQQLKPALSCRALCRLAELMRNQQNFNLVNKDGKTVVRLRLITYQDPLADQDQSTAVFVAIKGLRGYETAYKKVQKTIIGHNGSLVHYGPARLTIALANSNRFLFDYSNKFSVPLDGDWSVARVLSAICLELQDNMKRNYDSVLQDIDTEFLHDFRVAIRRTRSFLSLLKKVLPKQISHFMKEFKWLGSITGPVRDLDVYLLKQDDYQAILPEKLQTGLPYFFQELTEQRKIAFEQMVKGLQSQRFKQLMDDWSDYLNGFEESAGSGSWSKPCRPLAVKLVNKRFARIVKDGGSIDDTSEDELLHDLRIQAKKFRYLLEFFTPYFNSRDVKRFIKQLKKLQNNLGDFNDLSVQQAALEDYYDSLGGRTKQSKQVAAALGGLISHLAAEQVNVRNSFKRTFSRFTEKKNSNLFSQTFRQ